MSQSRYISVDGVRTHYLEAGDGARGARPTIVLLHSAEFGGAAEITWEQNIDVLAQRYHVLAPDHLGFGRTEKIFDFGNQFERRIRHIRRFIETMDVGPVHVMGSSMSGGLTLTVAARPKPDWPLVSVVCCSGGGDSPDNDARKVLNSYDGTKEHMRRIVDTMFVDKRWAADDNYIERRWELANLPGAWEATAAARFKAPFREASRNRSERDNIAYGNIAVPTLVFAGRHDPLRAPGYTDGFVPHIPNAELHVFEHAGHMGNIECASEFNARVMAFLAKVDGG
ncbi:MAG: alpha/beta fold hydrolase [Beijerinckiaceae bacterium]